MNKIFLLIFVFIFSSCIKEEPKSVEKKVANGLYSLSKNALDNIIVPAYKELAKDSDSFLNLVNQQCSLDNIGQFNRQVLKKSFLKLARSYHYTEVFQIGTIAENSMAMKEYLYSWPSHNYYLIDNEIVRKTQDSSYDYDDIPSAQGIPAIEYIVYEESLQNQCQDCGDKEMEAWNKLPTEKKIKSRCDYLIHVSENLNKQLGALAASWQGETFQSVSFKKNFVTVKEFAIQLTHALNFIDNEIKDRRLGIPSGINFDLCGFDSCPEQSEHLLSGDSLNSLFFTMKGLLEILSGDSYSDQLKVTRQGYGFIEHLAKKGHEQIVQDMINKTLKMMKHLSKKSRSGASIESLSTDIAYNDCKVSTSTNRKVEVCSLYQDIKEISTLYKNEFLLAADFGRPIDQGGDSD